jgi:hypothetical protein
MKHAPTLSRTLSLATTAAIATILTLLPLHAQTPAPTPDPVLKQTFAENEEGWKVLGGTGKAAITTTAGDKDTQVNALRFEYSIAKGDLNTLALPVTEGKLSRARSLRFRVKTDYTVPLVFALQEKDGGRWMALFTVPQGKWQDVQLSTSDFVLSQDKDDPADTNHKLDLDRIEYMGILDLNQFLVQVDNPIVAQIFDIRKGQHSLYLTDFVVTPDQLPGNAASSATGVLDTFARPQVGWLGIGGAQLSQTSGKPLSSPALQVIYRQAPGKFSGFGRSIGWKALEGRSHLAFRVASAKPATLIVQVEEISGGKYNTTLTLPGESTPKDISLAFADFDKAQDSADDNDRLDLGQVKQIAIVDISGFTSSADDDNTLWLTNLHAETKPVTPKGI